MFGTEIPNLDPRTLHSQRWALEVRAPESECMQLVCNAWVFWKEASSVLSGSQRSLQALKVLKNQALGI